MSGRCKLVRQGFAGPSAWELRNDALVLTPQGQPVETWPLREACGLDWDDLGVRLVFGLGQVSLTHLGSEAGGLVEALRSSWPLLRAAALRLGGEKEPLRFRGTVSAPWCPGPVPAEVMVAEDAVLVAPQGRDLVPVFLSTLADIVFDEKAYVVVARRWTGEEVRLGKLGGHTEEVRAALEAVRVGLSGEGAEVLATWLPGLDAPTRTVLASRWLPGRLMHLDELEVVAPGAWAAIRSSWLPALSRRKEAEVLLGSAAGGQVALGYTRPGSQGARAQSPCGDEPGAVEPGLAGTDSCREVRAVEEVAESGASAAGGSLWVAVRVPDGWLVECLGMRDVATYLLRGDEGLLEPMALMLCAPQFSREALYLPLEKLVGASSALAVAARELAPLQLLREAFVGRVIHRDLASWSTAVRAALAGGVSLAAGS